ncbi:hypothetical protein LCGC14_0835890 [marine sediment metagenome]|uniref:Uncharacterized protein n=1 Tax=marine sediment metagenome TaxID=412755 RepID=A0A0F9PJ61_9ZZZZ
MTKLPPPIGSTLSAPLTPTSTPRELPPKKDLFSKPVPKRAPNVMGTPPKGRSTDGLGIIFKDGWNFGLGFWLCSVVIIGSLGCIVAMGLAVLSGGLLGGLL